MIYTISLGIYVLLAVCGSYLLFCYAYGRYKGVRYRGQICGFQKKRFFGKRLPVVRLDHLGQKDNICAVSGIDSLTLWLKPLYEDDDIDVICIKGKSAQRGYIPGYVSLVAGLFMVSPVFYMLIGYVLGPFFQAGFIFIFIASLFIAGFLGLMRLVRFYY